MVVVVEGSSIDDDDEVSALKLQVIWGGGVAMIESLVVEVPDPLRNNISSSSNSCPIKLKLGDMIGRLDLTNL